MNNISSQSLISNQLIRWISFFIIGCIVSVFFQNCSVSESDDNSLLDFNAYQLSDTTLQQINVFFTEIDFKDTVYSFKKGVFVNLDLQHNSGH